MFRPRNYEISRLDVFNVKAFGGQQVVSVAVGAVVILIAVTAPRRYAFISPMAFILMWPAQGLYEARTKKKRTALEAQLSPEAISASVPHLPSQP